MKVGAGDELVGRHEQSGCAYGGEKIDVETNIETRWNAFYTSRTQIQVRMNGARETRSIIARRVDIHF